MGCKERGMMPTNRSRVGQLVMNGGRSERFLNLWRFISLHLKIDPALSMGADELENAYEDWSKSPIDRSGDMHNLSEFLTLLPDVSECVDARSKARILFGVGLDLDSD